MSTTDPQGAHPPAEPTRLSGWKEISAFLGKGVRTAQRWERTLKMPVHRIGHKGGEIVFAYADELNAWLKTAPFDAEPPDDLAPPDAGQPTVSAPPVGAVAGQDHPIRDVAEPSRRRWMGVSALIALGVLAMAFVIVGIGRLWAPSAPTPAVASRQPASWKVTGSRLQTFDASGTLLWEHPFDFDLIDYPARDYLGTDSAKVVLRDLDGDGTVETLFATKGKARTQRELYGFNSDGTVRFVDRPTGNATFGDTVYEPPWMAYRVFASSADAPAPAIWSVVMHGLWFPTRLRKLDARGRLISEYWSNGYIESLHEGTRHGRPVLFVGATNNETHGASLAIFDRDEVAGSAPSVDGRYTCRTCPQGGPEAFFVFPPSCFELTGGDQAFVLEAWVEGEDGLKVLVRHLFRHPTKELFVTDVAYTLDRHDRLVGIDAPKDYLRLHARLAMEGLLDHSFGPDDERALAEVRRWNGTAFTVMERAAVRR
jgi:hypothetical protein